MGKNGIKDIKAEKRARDNSDKCCCHSSLVDTGGLICYIRVAQDLEYDVKGKGS